MPDSPNPSTDPAFRILVIVSRPLDLNELPNIADQWALINGLATVKAPVEIKVLSPPTIEQLRTEVLNGYDIVHFDGHGSFAVLCPSCSRLNAHGSRKCSGCDALLEGIAPRGCLAFEQDDGRQDALAAGDLAQMLRDVPGSPTKLVVLSACQSAQGGDDNLASALLGCGVPAVLGMNETVPVEVTIALSRALFAALGSGMTIEDAFKKFALPALNRLPGHPDTGTKAVNIPVLQGKGMKAKLATSPARGSLIMEKGRLLGVPEFDFVGEFIPYTPPHGRKGLLFQIISALLDGEKMVVLTGQGGISKSVLAAAAARRMAWRYPGGIFWRSAVDIWDLCPKRSHAL